MTIYETLRKILRIKSTGARPPKPIIENDLTTKDIMPRKTTPRPTDSELAILRVLWNLGPNTVRQVQEELEKKEPTGYTTVLKLLQIMTEKGLVVRDETQRAHVYSAHHSAAHTQRGLVGDLLDRAYEGSAAQLVLQALTTRKASADERQEIRRLLDRMDREDTGRTCP